METILRTINLSKRYNDKVAIQNVNMNINRGDIYGFIGENGAGKTTLFKMIAGLAQKTSGTIELFGEITENGLHTARRRLGALIERPFLYANMTAYENLEACRLQKGIPGKDCIRRVLELLDLNSLKNKKIRDFSLGMKQKLGIAMAIIGDPELLILDEPINSIDPIGIMEIKDILLQLNRNMNTTILISSHILKELYDFATCYGIIHNGKLLDEFTLKELNERFNKRLKIKVSDVNRAALVLEENLNTHNFKTLPDDTILLYDYVDNPGRISSAIFKEGITILQLTPESDNLENYFKNMVGGKLSDV
ncbi:ABC transporter ATP-binding protein [Clostridium sp. AWRP]|uniref:ABC transporter ATP-binding protein n=1 Tax=Clostridium sp. AWRP TaxID=2212991 RepID=UPI000FDAFF49|nr:ABC transporter ATP-binding protein [Clostridium sp. AWRP]AZV57264.1 ABC transporter ATP-binding protein [Clostridium sp. AWRP]